MLNMKYPYFSENSSGHDTFLNNGIIFDFPKIRIVPKYKTSYAKKKQNNIQLLFSFNTLRQSTQSDTLTPHFDLVLYSNVPNALLLEFRKNRFYLNSQTLWVRMASF